jgi:hypothetical protein
MSAKSTMQRYLKPATAAILGMVAWQLLMNYGRSLPRWQWIIVGTLGLTVLSTLIVCAFITIVPQRRTIRLAVAVCAAASCIVLLTLPTNLIFISMVPMFTLMVLWRTDRL